MSGIHQLLLSANMGPTDVDLSYFIIGGGSGVGGGVGGGWYNKGGASGVARSGTVTVSTGSDIAVTIGAGSPIGSGVPVVAGGETVIADVATATGGYSQQTANNDGPNNDDYSGSNPTDSYAGGGGAGAGGNAGGGVYNANGGIGVTHQLLTDLSHGVESNGDYYVGGGGSGKRADEIAISGLGYGPSNSGSGGGQDAGNAILDGSDGLAIIKSPVIAASTVGSPAYALIGGFHYYKFTGSGSIKF